MITHICIYNTARKAVALALIQNIRDKTLYRRINPDKFRIPITYSADAYTQYTCDTWQSVNQCCIDYS